MIDTEFDFLENPPALAVGSDGNSEPPDGLDGFLLDHLVRKACIPRADAVLLLEEVMLFYFRVSMRIEIDARGWLVSATCNAARHYHATHPDSALAASRSPKRRGLVPPG